MMKGLKYNYIADAIVTVIIGLVLLLWPGVTLTILIRAIGLLLLVIGAVVSINFFTAGGNPVLRTGSLAGGIVVAVIGIWILINPTFFEALIPVIAGAVIVVGGLINLLQALSLWKNAYERWWIALVLSLITMLLGALLFTHPLQAAEIVVRIIGAFLVFDGGSNLWIASRVYKYVSDREQEATAIDVTAEDAE